MLAFIQPSERVGSTLAEYGFDHYINKDLKYHQQEKTNRRASKMPGSNPNAEIAVNYFSDRLRFKY